jgi:hypothetical protein
MPARFRQLKLALVALGCVVEKPRAGSHWRVVRAGHQPYTIPAHSLGAEVSDVYIRAACRQLGLDELALRARL